MSENPYLINYAIPSDTCRKIYEFYNSKRYSKITDAIEVLLLNLKSTLRKNYQLAELNFISEICIKACSKLIKQKRTDSKLFKFSIELSTNYSNSTRVACMSKIHQAECYLLDSKLEEAKSLIKSTIKAAENCENCSDIVPKLYMLLSQYYLIEPLNLQKSFKNSQKALDLCYRRMNISKDEKSLKLVLESLLLKGSYYVRSMDFKLASNMIDKVNELTGGKSLCKHLNEKYKQLSSEINHLDANNPYERRRSSNYKMTDSQNFERSEHRRNGMSRTVYFHKNGAKKQQDKQKSEHTSAIKIQNYFRMYTQKKNYQQKVNRKLLKYVKKTIGSVDYLISAILNIDRDIVIEASPLKSGVPVPRSFIISKANQKDYGIEDLNYLSNLLGWVSVINGRVFVSHKLNKKRLVFKGQSRLHSETCFRIKIFETDQDMIVQAFTDKLYEVILNKSSLSTDILIAPGLVLNRIVYSFDNLSYLHSQPDSLL